MADIFQLGNPVRQDVADVDRIEVVPFHMIKQEWIDRAGHPGVDNLDDLYNMLSRFYGQFDCESLFSLIYFTTRSKWQSARLQMPTASGRPTLAARDVHVDIR